MEPNDQVIKTIEALEHLGIEYMLVGSYSSNMYGIPRATQDADLVVQLGDRSVSAVAKLLGSEFHLDPQMSFETITSTLRYIIQHHASGFKLELFLLSNDPHDQERFARRKQVSFAGRPVFVATAEDVIVMKLRWSRGGDRRKDVEDVASVLAVQREALDFAYIRSWTDRHQTRELFERLLGEVRSR